MAATPRIPPVPHLGWDGPVPGGAIHDSSNPRTIDAMLFNCAICFAIASITLVGMFGLLVVLRDEPFWRVRAVFPQLLQLHRRVEASNTPRYAALLLTP